MPDKVLCKGILFWQKNMKTTRPPLLVSLSDFKRRSPATDDTVAVPFVHVVNCMYRLWSFLRTHTTNICMEGTWRCPQCVRKCMVKNNNNYPFTTAVVIIIDIVHTFIKKECRMHAL